MTTRKDLEACVEAGIESAQAVVDNWSKGDLAGAVSGLEDWATHAADLLPEPMQFDAGIPPKPDLCACDECGCTDIQATAWFELNSGEILPDDGPTDNIWCPQCDAECSVVYVTEHKPFTR